MADLFPNNTKGLYHFKPGADPLNIFDVSPTQLFFTTSKVGDPVYGGSALNNVYTGITTEQSVTYGGSLKLSESSVSNVLEFYRSINPDTGSAASVPIGATDLFTIEFYLRWNGLYTNNTADFSFQRIYSHDARFNPGVGQVSPDIDIYGQDTRIRMVIKLADGTGLFSTPTISTPTGFYAANTWVHVCIQKTATQILIYKNGVLNTTYNMGIYTQLRDQSIYQTRGDIFGDYTNSGFGFNGFLDEFRITVGVNRYTTSGFSLDATPYDDPPFWYNRGYVDTIFTDVQGSLLKPNTFEGLLTDNILETYNQFALIDSLGELLGSIVYGAAPSILDEQTSFTDVEVERALVSQVDLGNGLLVPNSAVFNDFIQGLINSGAKFASYYEMELSGPSGTTIVPISSWQATLQNQSANYAQCVVPGAEKWKLIIDNSTSFKINRIAVVDGYPSIKLEMLNSLIDNRTFDIGPNRYTCTISGYFQAFAVDDNPPEGYNRTLEDIRSISINNGVFRVRSGIDWYLKPSQRVTADNYQFIASYINYYVNKDDGYMDVGER